MKRIQSRRRSAYPSDRSQELSPFRYANGAVPAVEHECACKIRTGKSRIYCCAHGRIVGYDKRPVHRNGKLFPLHGSTHKHKFVRGAAVQVRRTLKHQRTIAGQVHDLAGSGNVQLSDDSDRVGGEKRVSTHVELAFAHVKAGQPNPKRIVRHGFLAGGKEVPRRGTHAQHLHRTFHAIDTKALKRQRLVFELKTSTCI